MAKKRVRMTARGRKAVDGSIPYPGNVNQSERQFKTDDQYSNYQESLNHPTPDMRHEWKEDERDEIGFGIPEAWSESEGDVTVANVRVAANKSVKLAYLLLGNKVAEEVIEEQANDFMLLGPEALNRSLARFAETGELYAEDDEESDDEEEESKEAAEESKEASDESKEVQAEEDKKEESKDDEEESKEAADESEEDKKKEEDEEESKEASDESKEVQAEEDKKEEDDEEESKEASKPVSVNDIELSAATDGGDVEPDERLAGIFDDEIPEELPEPGAGKREASEKEGVKSLGGQPRVAGNGGASQDISSIWNSAPDVSEIFN